MAGVVSPAVLALFVIEAVGFMMWLIMQPSVDAPRTWTVCVVLWTSLPVAGSILTGAVTSLVVGAVGRLTDRIDPMFVVLAGVTSSSITMAIIAASVISTAATIAVGAFRDNGGSVEGEHGHVATHAFLGAVSAGMIAPVTAGIVGAPLGVLFSGLLVQKMMPPAVPAAE